MIETTLIVVALFVALAVAAVALSRANALAEDFADFSESQSVIEEEQDLVQARLGALEASHSERTNAHGARLAELGAALDGKANARKSRKAAAGEA